MSQPFDPAYPPRPAAPAIGPLTAVIIGLSVVVAFVTKLGDERAMVERFYITVVGGPGGDPALPEVFQGEPWRVLTPIFLHFGIIHILFNAMAFKDLGTAIEKVVGSWTLLALVWVTGIGSNLVQFHFQGPNFGGLSGVVYGLFGYIWMKARFDPASGFYVPRNMVLSLIGWFIACAVGIIPHVANWAHGAGLAIGMLWGFAAAKARTVQ